MIERCLEEMSRLTMMMKTSRNRIFLAFAGWLILSPVSGCKPPEVPQSQAQPARKVSDTKPLKVDLSKEGPTDADAPQEFKTTSTGLMYRILRKTERDKPNEFSIVTMSQRGWLDDGTEIESSYELNRTNTAALDKLIPGLREGIVLIGEGGKIELEIPYQLAYGTRGYPPRIPGGATLHYIIELHSFK